MVLSMDETREQDRQIVEQWKNAAPKLQAKREEELRAQKYDAKIVNAIIDLGLRHLPKGD